MSDYSLVSMSITWLQFYKKTDLWNVKKIRYHDYQVF